SMKTAPNRYHWASSHAFELTEKSLRTTALPALMITAASTSQPAALPMTVMMRSINWLSRSRARMLVSLLGVHTRFRAGGPRGTGQASAAKLPNDRAVVGEL